MTYQLDVLFLYELYMPGCKMSILSTGRAHMAIGRPQNRVLTGLVLYHYFVLSRGWVLPWHCDGFCSTTQLIHRWMFIILYKIMSLLICVTRKCTYKQLLCFFKETSFQVSIIHRNGSERCLSLQSVLQQLDCFPITFPPSRQATLFHIQASFHLLHNSFWTAWPLKRDQNVVP
jgi:hypothetical protein